MPNSFSKTRLYIASRGSKGIELPIGLRLTQVNKNSPYNRTFADKVNIDVFSAVNRKEKAVFLTIW